MQPFYIEEIKILKKREEKLKFFTKEYKKLIVKQLSDVLPFPPKIKKRSKRRTKYQILSNILPFLDSAVISREQHTFRNYAGTYNAKVMDSKNLDDSLFLAKRIINDFFRDLLEETKGFKCILSTRVTLKSGII